MVRKTTQRTVPAGPVSRTVAANQNRNYEVHLVEDLVGANFGMLAGCLRDRQVLLVTTPTVNALYGDNLLSKLKRHDVDVSQLVHDLNEETKNVNNVMTVCARAQQLRFGRQSMLVGLGGGVCTDLVTMSASLIRRGIPYIRIPTTLLGQVDGSIGIKGAVNFSNKKNALGCYYSPHAVFVDPAFLRSLPPDQISDGVAEIIKMALVRDRRLFELLEQHMPTLLASQFQAPVQAVNEIIRRAIIGMIDELETNMYEDQTYQRLVDFGHTISPALESASQFKMPHGQAVAIGMAFCCELAKQKGLMTNEDCDRTLKTVSQSGLPTHSSLLTEDVVRLSLIHI